MTMQHPMNDTLYDNATLMYDTMYHDATPHPYLYLIQVTHKQVTSLITEFLV